MRRKWGLIRIDSTMNEENTMSNKGHLEFMRTSLHRAAIGAILISDLQLSF